MDWRMQDAETQLGTVIDRALSEGPQKIHREDATVVVVRAEEYERLLKRPSFKNHLLSGPSFEGLDLTRDKSPMREVDLGPE